MSSLLKIFKRKKRGNAEDSNMSIQNQSENRRLLHSLNNSKTSEHETDCAHEEIICTDVLDECCANCETNGDRKQKLRQLTGNLKRLQKHNEKLRRRHIDVMSLEAEVTQLLALIALSKRQCKALDEEILNKKCELKFLRSEAPEGEELEVKKREPLYFKKYNNIKSSSDAKNLIVSIRQRQRALQYLELMTFNKYMEYKHNLKSDNVKKRTSLLLKEKSRNFDHLFDALQAQENLLGIMDTGMQSPTQAQSGVQTTSENNQRSVTPIEISPAVTPPNNSGSPRFMSSLSILSPTPSAISPAVLSPTPSGISPAVFVPMPPPLPNLETSL